MFSNGICSRYTIIGELDIQGVITTRGFESFFIMTVSRMALATSPLATRREDFPYVAKV